MSINNVTISGNLTKDADYKSFEQVSLLRASVAVNDRVQNSNGEWIDRPNFVDCVLFGKRADALKDILKKGTKVAITGKLRWSSWEKDGAKHSKLEVTVDELELMSAKKSAKKSDDAEDSQYFE